jgi:hypothetical protein
MDIVEYSLNIGEPKIPYGVPITSSGSYDKLTMYPVFRHEFPSNASNGFSDYSLRASSVYGKPFRMIPRMYEKCARSLS